MLASKDQTTVHRSLAESRNIVINNIIPNKKETTNKKALADSVLRNSEAKIEKLYSQRKSYSYATPRGLTEHKKQASPCQEKPSHNFISVQCLG